MIITMPRFKMKLQKFPDEDQGTNGVTSRTNDYEKTHPSSSISSLLTYSSTSCPEEPLLLSTKNDHDCTMSKNTKANISSSSSSVSPQPSIFSTSSIFFTKNKNFNNVRHKVQFPLSAYSCASKENAIVISSSISDDPTGYADPRPNTPPSSSVSLSASVLENKTNRDIPVMESCQRRTLIVDVDHDDSANPNKKNRKDTKNAICSSTLSSSSVCYYSTSNYYPCTDENQEKTTMVIAASSVTAILTTLLMTSFKLLWSSHYHHHHQNHRQQNSKTNYQNLRRSTTAKTPAKGILFADTASFFSSLFTYGLLGSYLGIITLVHGQPPPLPPAGVRNNYLFFYNTKTN